MAETITPNIEVDQEGAFAESVKRVTVMSRITKKSSVNGS